jgi:hypothetical protein
MTTRMFSLREANAFVPRLGEIFAVARAELEEGQRLVAELEDLGHSPPAGGPIDPDPAAPADVRRRQKRLREVATHVATLFEEIAEMGAELKSPEGLVDFRSRRRGAVVYLCWRFGETEIAHWHDLESGFTGRRSIADAAEFEGDYLQ